MPLPPSPKGCSRSPRGRAAVIQSGRNEMFEKTKARIENKVTEPIQQIYALAITALVIACVALLASMVRRAH
jgi:hypothetical protein